MSGYYAGLSKLKEAWALTEALLRKLRFAVEADGAVFTVFYVPSRPGVYKEDWEDVRYAYAMTDEDWSPTQDARVLADICAANKFDCIVPLEEFHSEADEARQSGQSLYFHDDAHWTPRGHALAGRILADHVAQKLQRD